MSQCRFDIAVFIETIKKHPMLYDCSCEDYKNYRKREELWYQLADELPMNVSAESMKKKWKNLRDCHIKFLKNCKAGPISNYYNNWPWAKSMAFFQPYWNIVPRPNDENATQSMHDAAELAPCRFSDDFELIIDDPLRSTTTTKKRKLSSPKPTATTSSPKRTATTSSHHRPAKTWCSDCFASLDSTEHMFLAFAKAIKKLTPRRQTLTKMKISQMILESELEERHEAEEKQRASAGYDRENVVHVVNEADEADEADESSEQTNGETSRSPPAEWLHEAEDRVTKFEYN